MSEARGPLEPQPQLHATKVLRVFDPPMCCSTGVCGPQPDPDLARFAADLQWLEHQGVQVERYELSRQPQEFASTPAVADALRRGSIGALPLVLVGEEAIAEGTYPTRDELAARLGLELDTAPSGRLRILVDSGCVPGSGCCG